MAKQLSLPLSRGADAAFDTGFSINWHAIYRRARRIAAAALSTTPAEGAELRNGFALRAYADDAALLERFRALRKGRKLPCRHFGRLRIPKSVLLAVTPEGRRLNAVEARLEKRVAAREAAALCG